MSKRLWIAVTGSILVHIGAYLFLMELNPETRQKTHTWEVYTKKKQSPRLRKVTFKPKKKQPRKKTEKRALPKPAPRKRRLKKRVSRTKRPKRTAPRKLDFTKVGLSGGSFGGNGIALPLGKTTMGDPDRPVPPQKVTPKPKPQPAPIPKPAPRLQVTVRSLPKALRVPRYGYPARAREKGIQGTVKLLATIDTNGKVRYVRLLKGLGHGLDTLAIKALRAASFRPAYGSDGKPMRYTIRYRYRFTIEEE